ncbi:MAG: zf-HC2 domain-containing protein [Planctomyces sp.]|nr:zf-HC2 domain-containing protein [Planctomyces sp.]
MDCASALEGMSARLDGALAPDDASALDAHLEQCGDCRQAGRRLDDLHALCGAGLPSRASADRTTTAILRALTRDAAGASASAPVAVPPGPLSPSAHGRWGTLLAMAGAIAATIALLVVRPPALQQRARDASAANDPARMAANSAAVDPSAFRITLTSGAVESRPPLASEWTVVPQPVVLACPVGSSLRTNLDALCEFTCPAGGVVRLDEQCEVELTAVDEITVRKGRMWCQAAPGSSLKVISGLQPGVLPIFRCVADSSLQTEVDASDAITVLADRGDVHIQLNDELIQLEGGRRLLVRAGGSEVHESFDPIIDTAWMAPLLALRQEGGPELDSRLSRVLAGVGRSKASALYERQLVDLGAPGAIPLVAFLRSQDAAGTQDQRLAAANVIRRTAPASTIPDLVELLEDVEPEVRVAAAEALQRLTGETHGVPPEDWRTLGPAQRRAVAAWRKWLTDRGQV